MRMGTAADFMWEGNPANGAFLKPLAINQYTFGCPAIFVGDEADEIAVIFVHRANTRSKGCLASINALRKL